MRPSRNPWDILGLTHGATPEEIKRAYKEKALKYHPDRNGDEEIFKAVSNAYLQLKKRTHIPVLTKPDVKLINLKLSIQEQINGINGIISLDNGEAIEAKIPAGAELDEKFKVRSNRKNYIINIQELKHKVFTRQGFNVIMDLNVDIKFALIGGTLDIEGPSGNNLTVEVSAGTKPGSLVVFKNEGLLNRKKRYRGNLHIFLNYDIPILDTEEKLQEFIIRLKNE